MSTFKQEAIKIAEDYLNDYAGKKTFYFFKHKNAPVAQNIISELNNTQTDLSPKQELKIWKSIVSILQALKSSFTFDYVPGSGFNSVLLNRYIGLLEKRYQHYTTERTIISLYYDQSSVPKGLPSILSSMSNVIRRIENRLKQKIPSTIELTPLELKKFSGIKSEG